MSYGGVEDGVMFTRAATTILLRRKLPSFPRGEVEAWHRWRLSPDVVAAFRSLQSDSGVRLPLEQTQLLGYPIDVDETAPRGTIEMGGEGIERAAAAFDAKDELA